MKYMRFRTDYPRLKKKEFTTIRKNSVGKYIGHDVLCTTPTRAPFVAMIYDIKKMRLCDMSDEFLMQDTCTKTRAAAIALLNSFYDGPINPNIYMYVFYLRRKL